MRHFQGMLTAVAIILTVGAYSGAVDNKLSRDSTAAAAAANWPRPNQVDGTWTRSLRAEDATDNYDDSMRRMSSVLLATNDEERTSLARLAVAKAQIQYWSWFHANPNVVYRGFGLHKLNSEALKKSKLRDLWEAYSLKWKAKQPLFSFR